MVMIEPSRCPPTRIGCRRLGPRLDVESTTRTVKDRIPFNRTAVERTEANAPTILNPQRSGTNTIITTKTTTTTTVQNRTATTTVIIRTALQRPHTRCRCCCTLHAARRPSKGTTTQTLKQRQTASRSCRRSAGLALSIPRQHSALSPFLAHEQEAPFRSQFVGRGCPYIPYTVALSS